MAAVFEACEVHEAAAGEALVAEGTPSADLFLVLDGDLDITVGDQRLGSLGPGSYFGEVSLFEPGPSGASVISEQGCTVLRLSRSRFDALRAAQPGAAAALTYEALASLSGRLHAAAEHLAKGEV